ncbi:MAG: tetratricopeptide repeat protein [Sterolibacterium sp.]|nr:tetratricopeptide repeat protein [Sterolibacterium sp.]
MHASLRTDKIRKPMRHAASLLCLSLGCLAMPSLADEPSRPVKALGERKLAPPVSQKSVPGKSTAALISSKTGSFNPLQAGYAALLQQDHRKAEQAYRLALKNTADQRDAWLGLATIAHQQERIEDARAAYQRVLRLDPQNITAQAGLIQLLAVAASETAIHLARELAERQPHSATAQAALADALAQGGRLNEARPAYAAASALAPLDSIHAYNLAVACDHLHDTSQARQHYKRAIQLAEQTEMTARTTVLHSLARQRLAQLRPPPDAVSDDNDTRETNPTTAASAAATRTPAMP